MSSRTYVGMAMLGCVMAFGCLAATAQGDYVTVADWEFNSEAALLDDSSGNGNALANNGAVGYLNGNAGFVGDGLLSTVAALDLTSYSKVRVSWSQNAIGATANQQVWGLGASPYAPESNGAIVSYIKNMGGENTADVAVNNYSVVGGFNADVYSVTAGIMQTFAAEINLKAANVANIVQVQKDGTVVGSGAAGYQSVAPAAFYNDKFYIGARGLDGERGFIGEIGFLKIEGYAVPEPGTVTLLAIGTLGLLCYAWRKRK